MSKALESRADDDLFKIDRTGSKTAKRKIVKAKTNESEGASVSLVERRLIAKKMAELEKKKNKGGGGGEGGGKSKPNASVLTDLWSDDGMVVPKAASVSARVSRVNTDDMVGADVNNKKKSTKAPLTLKHEKELKEKNMSKRVKPAIPGMSYNPSSDAHQDALAEALALTIRKREEDALNVKVVDRRGLSELTKTLLTNESDDSDNDSDDDSEGSDDSEDDDGDGSADGVGPDGKKRNKLPRRAREKKTQAQRNKEKAKKLKVAEQKKAQKEKNMLKVLSNIPDLIKKIDQEETKRQAQKKLRKMLLENAKDTSSLTYAESGAVPLSDELKGSLRQVTPKGSAIVSQVDKMRETGDLMSRDRRKKRAYERPHKGERVVWIPKYKY